MKILTSAFVLLGYLVTPSVWADCDNSAAGANWVVADDGQGGLTCEDLGLWPSTDLQVAFEPGGKQIASWSTVDQSEVIGTTHGSGNRCLYYYTDNRNMGGGEFGPNGQKIQNVFACNDGVEGAPPPIIPTDTTAGCQITATDPESELDGSVISGVVFGPDTLGVCRADGSELQNPCVSFCRERPDIPASCEGLPTTNGTLPYECRRCEASKDFPNEQGLPYCAEYANSYCESQIDGAIPADPGCETGQPEDTIKPRPIGETTLVVHQEYQSSECGLLTVTLAGRQYSYWIPCFIKEK